MPTTAPDVYTRALTTDDLRDLLHQHAAPCVTIHLPTSPMKHEADQGRIRFKTAVKRVEESLESLDAASDEDKAKLLKPLQTLEANEEFWQAQTLGMSVFRNPDVYRIYKLPLGVREFSGVADSFHVKPLIRLLQDSERFRVLCVGAHEVALWEGNRQEIHPLELHADVPRTMAEALGGPDHVGKTKTTRFEPEDSDSKDRQLRRYFRRIDEAVMDRHPTPRHVPMILAALGEYQSHFREASHNPQLSEHGVKRDPFKDMTADTLRDLAWEALAPEREARLAELKDRYGSAAAHERGTDRLDDIARFATFGTIESLMIEEGHQVGGHIDAGTGEITYRAIKDPLTDDAIDDVAERVLRSSGEVLVLPRGQMPTDQKVAAILRKPATVESH